MTIGENTKKSVKEFYEKGMQKTAIARKLGISVKSVYGILNSCKNEQMQEKISENEQKNENILEIEEAKLEPSLDDYEYQCEECMALFNNLKNGDKCPHCDAELYVE